MIWVLVVAPTAGGRRGLEQLLREAGLYVMVEQRDTFESLDAVIDQWRPDVVVLEAETESHLAMPVVLEQPPHRDATPFVMLVHELETEAAVAALRAGARAALPRDATAAEIIAAVRAAAAGLASLSPQPLSMPSRATACPPQGLRVPVPSPREKQRSSPCSGRGLATRRLPRGSASRTTR